MKRVYSILIMCVLLLCPSACFAQFNPLPLVDMNSVSLVEACNAFLSMAKQDYRCTVPVAQDTGNGERVFGSYLGDVTPNDQGYGVLVLQETNEGNVLNAGITANMNDQTMMGRSFFVLTYMALSCGLTENEVKQLMNEANWKSGSYEGIEMKTSTVKSSANNQFYTFTLSLINPAEGGVYMMLVSHD